VNLNRSPLEGQWRCTTCNRIFGRCFLQCAYCPFRDATPPQARQAAPQALKPTVQVGRPARGVTGRVWAILDGLGHAAALPALLAATAAEGINESTARTQFSRWKKANPLRV
jgi:hypothetical protein